VNLQNKIYLIPRGKRSFSIDLVKDFFQEEYPNSDFDKITYSTIIGGKWYSIQHIFIENLDIRNALLVQLKYNPNGQYTGKSRGNSSANY